MIRIRLRRVGAKKQPSYRVVVADSRSPRDGRFIERLGWYNPRTDPPSFLIKEDRALYWLSVGAQPSDAVARLLKKMGTFEKTERVKAGASIKDVLAEAAQAQAPEPEVQVSLPTEAEIAVEESAAQSVETEEAEEAFEETGGEEEGEAA
jgi:small subunit ribosomal protein S16